MKNAKLFDAIAFVLVIIGGLNWGLIGILNIDLVAEIFGGLTTASQIIYTLVGLAALYLAINYNKVCKR
ncbi:MAG: DUF378 domain-containing protein [Candidatus Staskawiczbacteria bacterium]|jgi:hypothetical protein